MEALYRNTGYEPGNHPPDLPNVDDAEKTLEIDQDELEEILKVQARIEQISTSISEIDLFVLTKAIERMVSREQDPSTRMKHLEEVTTLLEICEKEVAFAERKELLYKKIESIYGALTEEEKGGLSLEEIRESLRRMQKERHLQAAGLDSFEKKVDARIHQQRELEYNRRIDTIQEKLKLLKKGPLYPEHLVRLTEYSKKDLTRAIKIADRIIDMIDFEISLQNTDVKDIDWEEFPLENEEKNEAPPQEVLF